MAESTIPGSGEYADLARLPDGRIVLCTENASRDAIDVYADAYGQTLIALLPGAFAGDRIYALYPRLACNHIGQIAVAYQKGPSIALALLGVRDIVLDPFHEPFGSEMCCVAWIGTRWRLAYVARMTGQIRLITRDYDNLSGEEIGVSSTPTDTTQGISRIDPDGTVITIDQDFLWPQFPNLSRPYASGRLTVGQGNDEPARCLGYLDADTVQPYRVFDGLAFRPRCAPIASGWTVIAAGDRVGIRVVDVPPLVADVVIPPPAPESLPVGTVIEDTLPYIVSTRWPRTADDGGTMDCVPVDGQDAVTWVKFASPSFCEWWRWDEEFIYHHEDRSDGLDQPYHFEKDQWMRRRWAVGEAIDSRVDNWLWRTSDEGDNWFSRPWAMVMRLVGAFDAYPCGGDIGDAPCIVVEYDPTYTLEPRRGGVERFWFAEGWGWWRWQSAPFGTVFDFSTDPTTATLTDAKFHRLGGQRVTPINPVRQWPSDVPPVDPPEEEPVKPQDQFAREFRDTNDFYKAPDGLQRPGGMVLNGECDVEAMQQWGYQLLGNNHSVNWVKNQIVRSDEWAQKHPGEAPPTFPEGAGDQ